MTLRELLERLDADYEFLSLLVEAGVLDSPIERDFSDDEAEEARIARMLMLDLEVNMAGVEVVLHMRRQILALRRQMGDLLDLLRRERSTRP
jgi:hypothetical protein